MEDALIGRLTVEHGLRTAVLPGRLPDVLRVLAAAGAEPVCVDLLDVHRVRVAVPAAQADALNAFPGATQPRAAVRVTLHGAGLRGDPALVPAFCEVLARVGAAPSSVAAESARVSAVVADSEAAEVLRGLREVFETRAAAVPARI